MISKHLFPLLIMLSAFFGFSENCFAQHEEMPAIGHEVAGEEKKLDVAGELFGHVSDAHEWHFFTLGESHISLPLPVIVYDPANGLSVFSASHFGHFHKTEKDGKSIYVSESHKGYHLEKGITEKLVADNGSAVYDFSITKNVLSMLLGVGLLLAIMLSVSKKYKTSGALKAPSGLQNAIESCVVFIRDEVAKPNIGPNYMKFMPLLLTIFFFIWINNLLGLIPSGANLTGNIATTASLAFIAFVVMLFTSKKYFWGHLLNPPGLPFWVKCILVPIEIISLLIKPIALMIRLFANMLAGHIVILSFIMLVFIFAELNKVVGASFSIVSVLLATFSFLIELLVTAIQAFIFANLTAVFIGQMVEEHSHDAHEEVYDHAHSDLEISA